MRRARGLIMVVAVLGSLAAAAAQEAPPAPPVEGENPTPPAEPARPLTPAEMNAGGEQIVKQGEALSQRVRGLLDQARKESDIIKVTCLNDKLTQINANLRTASARLGAMQKAGDPDLRNHEYTVLSVLGQKFQVLDQEAGQCVGQDMFDTGATRVTTAIDESSIPDESPTELPTIMPPSSVLLVAPPPPASGTF